MDRPTINTLEETSEIQTILSEHRLSAYIAVRDGNLKDWSALTTIKNIKYISHYVVSFCTRSSPSVRLKCCTKFSTLNSIWLDPYVRRNRKFLPPGIQLR